MRLIIKNATLIFPDSGINGEKADIFIKDGKIELVGKSLAARQAQTLDVKGACVSPGWLDIGAFTGDPGFEHRENFRSIAKAAAAGGYTALACLPNTLPTIHSKSEVEYVRNHSNGSLVEFLPIGAVSTDCKGKDITEMYDMHAAGAVAFSDGKKSVQDSGLLLRALLYVRPFNGVILNQPFDETVAPHGQMHEGAMSASLGLKGIPSLAEELMIRRDIFLAGYADSHLHIHNISSTGAVELVREAKSKGLKVTASAAAMNIACDDQELYDYDTNFKVMPPIRETSDFEALRQGLADGTIDCITSNHTPLDAEAKDLEFPFAEFGAIGLESAFGLSWMHLHKTMSISDFVEKIAIAPRRILSLPIPQIAPGEPANLTIFDPNLEWTFSRKDIFSISKNSPFIGWRMKGKVLAVIRGSYISGN